MAYGTPRAILSDGAIRCIRCAIVKFTIVKNEDIDSDTIEGMVRACDRGSVHDNNNQPLSVVREGQNQDFLVESYCEDCNRDLEADCTDY